MNSVRFLCVLTILAQFSGSLMGAFSDNEDGADVSMLDWGMHVPELLMADEDDMDALELESPVDPDDDASRVFSELLLNAVKERRRGLVRELITRGASVDYQDENGETPLMVAAVMGSLSMVRLFLEVGKNRQLPWVDGALTNGISWIDLQDRRGYTALMQAASRGHIRVVRELLAAGARLDVREERYGSIAFLVAAYSGYHETVAALARHDASQVLTCDKEGDAALMIATANGDEDTVDALLRGGAGRGINAQNEDGATPLIIAAKNDDPVVARQLLQGGAWRGILIQDNKGKTALSYAEELDRHSPMSKLLRTQVRIAQKADSNVWEMDRERDPVPVMAEMSDE